MSASAANPRQSWQAAIATGLHPGDEWSPYQEAGEIIQRPDDLSFYLLRQYVLLHKCNKSRRYHLHPWISDWILCIIATAIKFLPGQHITNSGRLSNNGLFVCIFISCLQFVCDHSLLRASAWALGRRCQAQHDDDGLMWAFILVTHKYRGVTHNTN